VLARFPSIIALFLIQSVGALYPSYCQGQTTPSITFAVGAHTYGDAPFAVSATSNSGGSFTYSVVSGPVTLSGTTVTLTGAGSVTLQVSQAALAGYTVGVQTASFAVAPAPSLIIFAVPDHAFGDPPFNVGASSKSTGAWTYSVISGPASISVNTVTVTGLGSVVLQASQAADTNYLAGNQKVTFAVTPASPSISFTPGNHTLGDAPFPVSASSKSTGAFTYSIVSGPATISDDSVTLTAAGTVVIQATQAAASNYAAGTQDATIVVAPAQPSCNNCYASLGAGSVLNSTKFGDYNNSSNILQTTHLGSSTPQYTVGLAYKLPIYGPFAKVPQLHCGTDAYTVAYPEARSTYCFPLKAFVSLKFTPDASQTLNGFTFGLSHALASYNGTPLLDLMVGVSYTAFNEVSPGFQQAAINTVTTQQAANNPYYAQYNLEALKANNPTAFDGFPIQLLKADGTTGPLIYTASPLVSHYHSGLFLGVSIPILLKSFLGIK